MTLKAAPAVRTAKIFQSGRSQAVRLPKAFRFEGKEVRIRREGDAVILEPMPADPWAWLSEVGPLDDDFVRAALDRPPPEDRPDLDKMFD
jgi:antitoxin VapB